MEATTSHVVGVRWPRQDLCTPHADLVRQTLPSKLRLPVVDGGRMTIGSNRVGNSMLVIQQGMKRRRAAGHNTMMKSSDHAFHVGPHEAQPMWLKYRPSIAIVIRRSDSGGRPPGHLLHNFGPLATPQCGRGVGTTGLETGTSTVSRTQHSGAERFPAEPRRSRARRSGSLLRRVEQGASGNRCSARDVSRGSRGRGQDPTLVPLEVGKCDVGGLRHPDPMPRLG